MPSEMTTQRANSTNSPIRDRIATTHRPFNMPEWISDNVDSWYRRTGPNTIELKERYRCTCNFQVPCRCGSVFRKAVQDRDTESRRFDVSVPTTGPNGRQLQDEVARLESARFVDGGYTRPFEVLTVTRNPDTDETTTTQFDPQLRLSQKTADGLIMFEIASLNGRHNRKLLHRHDRHRTDREDSCAQNVRGYTSRVTAEAAAALIKKDELEAIAEEAVRLNEQLQQLTAAKEASSTPDCETTKGDHPPPLYECGQSVLQWYQGWMVLCTSFPTMISVKRGSGTKTYQDGSMRHELPAWYLGEVCGLQPKWREDYWWGGHSITGWTYHLT